MRKQNIEVVDNMEFLIEELHKEWDRSGADKASVFISLKDVEEINRAILVRIAKVQKKAENEEIDFKKFIKLTKESYVLLRLARKIKTEEHRTYNNGTCYVFEVRLDRDELKLYSKMFRKMV